MTRYAAGNIDSNWHFKEDDGALSLSKLSCIQNILSDVHIMLTSVVGSIDNYWQHSTVDIVQLLPRLSVPLSRFWTIEEPLWQTSFYYISQAMYRGITADHLLLFNGCWEIWTELSLSNIIHGVMYLIKPNRKPLNNQVDSGPSSIT